MSFFLHVTFNFFSGLALEDKKSSDETTTLPAPHEKHLCRESVLSIIETVRRRTADGNPNTHLRFVSFSSQCVYIHPNTVNFRRNSSIRIMWVDNALCSSLKFLCFTAGNDECNECVGQVA